MNKIDRMTEPIYISGAITNELYPFKRFQRAYNDLKIQKYGSVLNPCLQGRTLESIFKKLGFGEPSWWSYMVFDLIFLFRCSQIYMLSNWKKSRGARIEYAIMKFRKLFNKNIIIIYEEKRND